MEQKFDIYLISKGGGLSGQAEAILRRTLNFRF